LNTERLNKYLEKLISYLNRKDVAIVVSVFLIIWTTLYLILFTPNYYTKDSPIQFDIHKGEPLSSIIDRLYDENIIPSKNNMYLAAYIYGAQNKLRAARFHIPNGLSYLDLIDLFTDGKADFLREVDLRDGLSVKWMAYVLKDKIFMDSTSFVNLSFDKQFVHSLGLKRNSFEGFLMPGKYEFYERSSAKEIIKILYNSFNKFMVDSLWEQTKKNGYSFEQIVTLASIVKGETNYKEEMPRIASVYLNRLRIGMKLQADPTIQYLQTNGWKRLLFEDLKIDSPYNTYLYAGLPPGPINNPGKTAILSVLYPEKTKYLYFVANGKGQHNFARTYNQHLNNVNKFRRWLIEQKRKEKQKAKQKS